MKDIVGFWKYYNKVIGENIGYKKGKKIVIYNFIF